MNETATLNHIKQLALEHSGIETLWLYGSRAKGTATEHSDYDLAVRYSEFLSNPLKSRLRPELLAMDWQQIVNVDLSVVDIELAPTPLAAEIVDHGLLLMDKTPWQTAWLYQKIWSKWDDWLYHRAFNQ